MTKCIEIWEARSEFVDLMDSVHYGGQTVIIERFGRPVAAIVPVETYQQLIAHSEGSNGNHRIRLPQATSESLFEDSNFEPEHPPDFQMRSEPIENDR